MKLERDIGIGLIGAGSMAHAYAECLLRYTTGARLVSVTGGSRAPELAKAYGVVAEPSVGELLQLPGLDAIIIATPEMLHLEQTLLAAASGRHVLVEKPMAATVPECDEMIAACERAGVRLMVVKHWRFRGVHVRALDKLRAGKFGAIRAINNHTLTSRTSSLSTVTKKPFYLDPTGGGLLMGWATHNLDWVRCLADAEPWTIDAAIAPAVATLGDGSIDAQISFANGIKAEVRVAIDLPEDPGPDQVFRTRIVTDQGELDLDGYGHLRVRDRNGDRIEWTQPAFNPRDPVNPRRLEAYAALLQGFINSIRDATSPPITGHDGRMAVALFQAARESTHNRGTVALGF